MKRFCLLILLLISIIAKFNSILYGQGQYIEINDIKMYYEIHGTGKPLLLLHGGLSGIQDFANQIPIFKEDFQVIAPESRGQARTTDSKRPITYELMTSDIAKLLDHLNIDSLNVVGYSDGGVIGLHLATSYPHKVKKLVVIGANFRANGLEENMIALIKNAKPDIWPEVVEHYNKSAPDPDHWPITFEKIRTMWITSPNLATDILTNIKVSTLVIVGDRDGFIRFDHTIELFKSIPNSQLCVIPGTTHFVPFEKPELLNQIIIEFLQSNLSVQKH